MKVGQEGFTEDGLPGWARIGSQLRFRNTGREEGGVEWAIDLATTRLPDFLTIEGNIKGSLVDFNSRLHPEITTPIREFDLRLTQQSSKVIAESLGSLKSGNYAIAIPYRTTRVSGNSEWKKLKIEIDVRDFTKSIVEYWQDHPEFNHLAELADPNHKIV